MAACTYDIPGYNGDSGFVLVPVFINSSVSFTDYEFRLDDDVVPHIKRAASTTQIRAYVYVRLANEVQTLTVSLI